MRADGAGKKKLIAAFHFQFTNQAGWKCGDCRKQGLEQKRGCGRTPGTRPDPPRVVWTRKRFSLSECPRALISAQSLAYLEEFYVWRLTSRRDLLRLPARKAEAFLILESLELEEQSDERR